MRRSRSATSPPGLFCAVGILSRARTRASAPAAGQQIDTSLFEGALALSIWETAELWATGRVPEPLGSAHRLTAPYQALRTRDGHITVGGNNQRLWERLCEAIGRPELADDPRFATNDDRMANRAELVAELESALAARDTDDVGRGAARGRRAVRADPRLRAGVRGPAHAGARDGGRARASGRGHGQRARHPGQAVSETPGSIRRPAPLLGEHTDEVLREAGSRREEIAAL